MNNSDSKLRFFLLHNELCYFFLSVTYVTMLGKPKERKRKTKQVKEENKKKKKEKSPMKRIAFFLLVTRSNKCCLKSMGSCHPVHPKKETLQVFAHTKREGSFN